MGVLAMMSMSLEEGVTPELEQFAKAVGLDCLDALDAQSLKSGDDPKGFANVERSSINGFLHIRRKNGGEQARCEGT